MRFWAALVEERDPERWEPVFGKDHAQTKERIMTDIAQSLSVRRMRMKRNFGQNIPNCLETRVPAKSGDFNRSFDCFRLVRFLLARFFAAAHSQWPGSPRRFHADDDAAFVRWAFQPLSVVDDGNAGNRLSRHIAGGNSCFPIRLSGCGTSSRMCSCISASVASSIPFVASIR